MAPQTEDGTAAPTPAAPPQPDQQAQDLALIQTLPEELRGPALASYHASTDTTPAPSPTADAAPAPTIPSDQQAQDLALIHTLPPELRGKALAAYHSSADAGFSLVDQTQRPTTGLNAPVSWQQLSTNTGEGDQQARVTWALGSPRNPGTPEDRSAWAHKLDEAGVPRPPTQEEMPTSSKLAELGDAATSGLEAAHDATKDMGKAVLPGPNAHTTADQFTGNILDQAAGLVGLYNNPPWQQAADDKPRAEGGLEDTLSKYAKSAKDAAAADPSLPSEIGRGVAHVGGLALGGPEGKLGLLVASSRAASEAYSSTMTATGNRHDASTAAAQTLPALSLYLVGGQMAAGLAAKVAGQEAPAVVKALYGFAGAEVSNVGASAVLRVMEAKPGEKADAALPTMESFTADTLFAVMHGVGEYKNATNEAKAKAQDLLIKRGVAPEQISKSPKTAPADALVTPGTPPPAVPAYAYRVNEDPGATVFPGQIGERDPSTVDSNYGKVLLSAKLTPEQEAEHSLSYHGETTVPERAASVPGRALQTFETKEEVDKFLADNAGKITNPTAYDVGGKFHVGYRLPAEEAPAPPAPKAPFVKPDWTNLDNDERDLLQGRLEAILAKKGTIAWEDIPDELKNKTSTADVPALKKAFADHPEKAIESLTPDASKPPTQSGQDPATSGQASPAPGAAGKPAETPAAPQETLTPREQALFDLTKNLSPKERELYFAKSQLSPREQALFDLTKNLSPKERQVWQDQQKTPTPVSDHVAPDGTKASDLLAALEQSKAAEPAPKAKKGRAAAKRMAIPAAEAPAPVADPSAHIEEIAQAATKGGGMTEAQIDKLNAIHAAGLGDKFRARADELRTEKAAAVDEDVSPTPRTYDDVQKDIDAEEDKIEAGGGNPMRLADPGTPNGKALIKNGDGEWRPMPPKLSKLYAERDAVGGKELDESKQHLSDALSKTGLSTEEIRRVLNDFGIDPNKSDVAAQYLAAKFTSRIATGDPLQLSEKVAYSLAAERGEPYDELRDVSDKTKRDAAVAVKTVREYLGIRDDQKALGHGENSAKPAELPAPKPVEKSAESAETPKTEVPAPKPERKGRPKNAKVINLDDDELPKSYGAAKDSRAELGDEAAAKKVGITPEEVQGFMSGENKTGINPDGHGQDGLTLEIAKRLDQKPAPNKLIEEPQAIRTTHQNWVDSMFEAYAHPEAIKADLESRGFSAGQVAAKVRAVEAERAKLGRTTERKSSISRERLNSFDEMARKVSNGNDDAYDTILNGKGGVREQLEKNFQKTGDPVLSFRGEDGTEAHAGIKQLISRRAINYFKRGEGKNTYVPLEDGDKVTGDEGISQLEQDSVANARGTTHDTDESGTPVGEAKARIGVTPARAVEAAERSSLRSAMVKHVADMVHDFSADRATAMDGVEVEKPSAVKPADIERAAGILLWDRFHGALWDSDIRRGGKNEAVTSLLEDERFQQNVEDVSDAIVEKMRAEYPELGGRYSVASDAAMKADMRAQAVWIDGQAKEDGYEGMADLLGRNKARFDDLASQWRSDHPRESLGEATTGMKAAEAADAIHETLATLPKVMGRTTVVQSETDLPAHLQRDGGDAKTRGVFDPVSGRIYLVADNLSSPHEAVGALLHEAIGEYGIDHVLGDHNWGALSKDLLASASAEKISQTYLGKGVAELDPTERSEMAREVLSHLAESPAPDPTFAQKIWTGLRNILRSLGVNLKYTDADLADIVRKARGYVSDARPEEATPQKGSPRFSKVSDYLDWFNRPGLKEADEDTLSDLRSLDRPGNESKVNEYAKDILAGPDRKLFDDEAGEPVMLHELAHDVDGLTSSPEAARYALKKSADDLGPAYFRRVLEGVSRAKTVRDEYRTNEGPSGMLQVIADKAEASGKPLQRQLAAILKKAIGKMPVHIDLDPTLAARGLNGMAEVGSNGHVISLDPGLDEATFHAAAIEEHMHVLFHGKLDAFRRGDFSRLSPGDVETLGGINDLYEKVLDEAPPEIKHLFGDPTLSNVEKFDRFSDLAKADPSLEPWYHALNMDEFVAGTFTSPTFQRILANIDASESREAKAPKTSLLRRMLDTFSRIVLGKGVSKDSALYKSTTNVFELLDRNDSVLPRSAVDAGGDAQLGSFKGTLSALLKDRKSYQTALIRKFADKYVDLRDAVKTVETARGVDSLPNTEDAARAVDLMAGRVPHQLRALQEGPIRDLLETAKRNNVTMQEASLYIKARGAEERNKRVAKVNSHMPDGGSGMKTVDANTVLRDFRAQGKTTALEEVAAVHDKINAARLKLQRDSGILSKAAYDTISKAYLNYVDYSGFENPDDAIRAGVDAQRPFGSSGNDVRGGDPKRITGRVSASADPIQNAILGYARVVERAEENRCGKILGNLVDSHADATMWSRAEPEYILRPNKETGIVDRVVDPTWMKDNNIISYRDNGENKYLRIENPDLARVWKGGGGAAVKDNFLGMIRSGLATFGRYKAFVSTQGDPSFGITKLLRDIQETVMNIQGPEFDHKGFRSGVVKDLASGVALRGALEGVKPGMGTGQNGSATLRKLAGTSSPAVQTYAKSFAEMDAHGGRIQFLGQDNIKQHLLYTVGAASRGKVHEVLGGIVHAIGAYNEVAENATRLAVYHNLRVAGVDADKAAYHARNITVNFNRKGEYGQALNTAYVFYNANVQTTARLIQSLQSRGWKGATKTVLGLTALGFGTASLARFVGGKDDDGQDRVDKIPDHERHNNLIFMLPEGVKDFMKTRLAGIPGAGKFLSQDGGHIKIPMPYGYGFFVANGSTLEKHLAGSMTAAHALTDTAANATEIFDPQGGAGNLLQKLMPTIGRPFLEMAQNQTATGAPIVPQDSPFKKGEQAQSSKYFPNSVNPITKGATAALNRWTGGDESRGGYVSVSPAHVDYMLNAALGSMGTFFAHIAGGAYGMAFGPKAAPGDDAFPAKNVPFLNRIFGSTHDVSEGAAYTEIQNQVNTSVTERQGRINLGDAGGARAVQEKYTADFAMQGVLNKANSERAQFHKDIALLRNQPGGEEKFAPEISALNQEDRKVQEQTIRTYIQLHKLANGGGAPPDDEGTFGSHMAKYGTHAGLDLGKQDSIMKLLTGFDL